MTTLDPENERRLARLVARIREHALRLRGRGDRVHVEIHVSRDGKITSASRVLPPPEYPLDGEEPRSVP